MKYYRLTKNFADIGKLIPETDDIYQHIENLNEPYFKSIYYYTDEQKKQAEEIIDINGRKRPRGIAGVVDVTTNKIVFDLDCEQNIENARKDTITVCERLLSHGLKEENIQICFSGKKGFAVEVEFEDSWFTPQEVKNIVNDFAHDLDTFDGVVVNPSRIFRIPFTKHNSTDCYKTPLNFSELKSLEIKEIKDIARTAYDPDVSMWEPAKTPTTFDKIKEIEPEVPERPKLIAGQEHDLDFSNMPKGFTKWKYALLQGYFPEGTRSNALIILASTLKYFGYDATTTYYMLKSAADLQAKRFDCEKFSKDDIWTTIISQVFSQKWKGGCYSEDNFPPQLQKYLMECGVPRSRKESKSGLQGVKELFGSFKNFAENIDQNTIKTGIPAIDDNMRLTTGMLVGLLGGPSSGKTSLALTFLNECSLNNEEAVFFSMDMNSNLIYQKLGQKHMGCDGEKIFQIFKNQETEQIKKIAYKINQNYLNTQFDFRTALTVEEMRDEIIEYEESTGKKVKLVVVDYLECISTQFSDPTASGGYAANALKDLASDLDVCVVLLLQTQKMSGAITEPLRSLRKVKGSSVLEQACSAILSIWREGADPKSYENDRFITFCCCKNRLGKMFEVDCGWSGIDGEVYELDDNGKQELEEMRKMKKVIEKVAEL